MMQKSDAKPANSESLHDRLSRTRLPIDDALKIAAAITKSLAALHETQSVHGALHPLCISLGTDEAGQKATIHRTLDARAGTSRYIAPEQSERMRRTIDHRTDLYSLGCIIYEILSGTVPFAGGDASEFAYALAAREPEPLRLRDGRIPEPVSRLVGKMLSKDPEARYQSASGVLHDLNLCLTQWTERGEISDIEIGTRDVSRQLKIPRTLFGREKERERLLEALHRAAAGETQFVLLAGFSGLGKTMLALELQAPTLALNGFFTSGKYDQMQGQSPYFAIAQALRRLVHGLLAEHPTEIATWRQRFIQALGENAQICITLVPELELIIGPQPAPIPLGASETRTRYMRVLQSFIGAFSAKGRPLVIFLDDLQWIDSASAELLKTLGEHHSSLCFIGCYRGDEVESGHILNEFLDDIRRRHQVREVFLQPLTVAQTQEMLGATLYCGLEDTKDLAELLRKKTGGNPFFIAEFLRVLVREGHLRIGNGDRWRWSLSKIEKLDLTDNVVHLVTERLERLPTACHAHLKTAAFIGSTFTLHHLASVSGCSSSRLVADLVPAIAEGLLIVDLKAFEYTNLVQAALEIEASSSSSTQFDEFTSDITLRFAHDRIQQAAAEMMAMVEAGRAHAKIGEILLSSVKDGSDERVIEIVNHLNAAHEMGSGTIDVSELIRLNRRAAEKAKQAGAFGMAASYAEYAIDLIGEWDAQPELMHALHVLAGECLGYDGQFVQAEKRLLTAISRSSNSIERGETYLVRVRQLSALGRYDEAVGTGVDGLLCFGIEYPAVTDGAAVATKFSEEYALYLKAIETQSIASFIALPINNQNEHRLQIQLLAAMLDCAIIGPTHYLGIVALKIVNLSVARGNTMNSPLGFMWTGVVEIALRRYEAAEALGRLALALVERNPESRPLLGHALNSYATFISYLHHPTVEALPYWERGYHEALASGDLLYAAYSAINGARQSVMWNASTLDVSIDYISKQMERIDKFNSPPVSDSIRAHRGYVLAIRGLTSEATVTDHEDYSEAEYCAKYAQAPLLTALVKQFNIIAHYLAGDTKRSLALSLELDPTPLETFLPHAVEHRLFTALSIAAEWPDLAQGEREILLPKLHEAHAFLKGVADSCPINFLAIERIVAADLAHIDNRPLEECLPVFEHAIESARQAGFRNFEAIALERAGLVALSRKQPRIAGTYLSNACAVFGEWGAEPKVEHLRTQHKGLAGFERAAAPMLEAQLISATPSAGALDLATALKAAQSISSEIVTEKLLMKTIETMLECSGAQVAIYVLEAESGELTIHARGDVDDIRVFESPFNEYTEMCRAVVRFVQRTHEPLILNDAFRHDHYANDAYVRERRTKSILCLPFRIQGRNTGYLYLENNLVEKAFTADRVEILQLLSAQASTAIENALLYERLEKKVLERTHELNRSLDELKSAQVQLANSSRMSALGQMAGGVAHEINTPLAVVRLTAELLQDDLQIENFDRKTATESVTEIIATVDRVAKIISGLRTISRDGRQDPLVNVPVRDLFTQSLALCQTKFEVHDVQITVDDVPPDAVLPCRGTEIAQVILNLLNNAFDAIEGQSVKQIGLGFQSGDAGLEISVTDNGPGVPKAIREKLFNPFFTTKGVGKGTGLGLSISQGILTNHGGELILDETSEKTRFVLQFPRVQNSRVA